MTSGDHEFPVRVQRTGAGAARAYARAQSFDVGSQASLRESDPQPSAIEYALGALGGDLLWGLERAAESEGLTLHAVEVALKGRLENILVHLGVVGEAGHAGIAAIDGTIYVSTEGDAAALESAWQATLSRSPLYNTFTRCAAVSITLKVIA
jgi:OsmC-like protein